MATAARTTANPARGARRAAAYFAALAARSLGPENVRIRISSTTGATSFITTVDGYHVVRIGGRWRRSRRRRSFTKTSAWMKAITAALELERDVETELHAAYRTVS